MDLSKILSISGKPGLYEMVSNTNNGLIVESLMDKKRTVVYSTYQISSLEEIRVFFEDEEVELRDIFNQLFEKLDGKAAISPKSSKNDLVAFFNQHLPGYDEDRVYPSDMKKIIKWYNELNSLKHLPFEAEEEETEVKEESKEEEKPSEENNDKS